MAKSSLATKKGVEAPHQGIETDDPRERFLLSLFDELWRWYRSRVPAVGVYERIVAEAGGRFVNDHIAFRTFAAQDPFAGIASISRIFEALGYEAAGVYRFPDKHLASIHFQHPRAELPKLFLSELRSWELGPAERRIIRRVLKQSRPPVAGEMLAQLHVDPSRPKLFRAVVGVFTRLPWKPPRRKDVLALNEASQFGAWVLVHGYAVNHFTALVNSHGVRELSDIEKTVAALKKAGVGMKDEIEGARGSGLRQTATQAADAMVRVAEGKMPWTYAYFEIAERGAAPHPSGGAPVRFEGFLGPQASQLFEMTRRKG